MWTVHMVNFTCLSLSEEPLLKTWYCPYCSRLPQFKQRRRAKKSKEPPALNQAAMQCSSICICNVSATSTDRLLECHATSCGNGHYFHLSCLGLKRMPRQLGSVRFAERNKSKVQSLLKRYHFYFFCFLFIPSAFSFYCVK